MTACNTFGKRPCGWDAQKPCVIRAEARIDFTSLTRSVFTCSKRLLFEHLYYRKFTGTCGCNPKERTLMARQTKRNRQPHTPLNQTVSFDDFLVGRLSPTCATCGRSAADMRNLVWGSPPAADGRSLAIALVLCVRCLSEPDRWAKLDRDYRQRYGFDLDGDVTIQGGRV
jgi:hypothetical protein